MERKLLNRVLDLNDDVKDIRILEIMREKLYRVDVVNIHTIFSDEEAIEKANEEYAQIIVEANKMLDVLEIKDEKSEEFYAKMNKAFSALNKADLNARKKMEEALDKKLKNTDKVYLNPFDFLKDEDGIEDALNAIEELLEASIAYRAASTEEMKRLGDIKLRTLKTACNALGDIKEHLKEKIKEEEEQERREKENQEGFKILTPEEVQNKQPSPDLGISNEKSGIPLEKILVENNFLKAEYLQDTHDITSLPADSLVIPLIRIETKSSNTCNCTIECIPFINCFRVNLDNKSRYFNFNRDVVNVFRRGYDNVSGAVDTVNYIDRLYGFMNNFRPNGEEINYTDELKQKINDVLVNLKLFKDFGNQEAVEAKLPRINGFDPDVVDLIKDVSKLDIVNVSKEDNGIYRLVNTLPFLISPDVYSDHLYRYSYCSSDTSLRYQNRDYPEQEYSFFTTDMVDLEETGEDSYLVYRRISDGEEVLLRDLPLPISSMERNGLVCTNRDLMIYTYLESLICDSDYSDMMEVHTLFKLVFKIKGLTVAKKKKETGNSLMFFKDNYRPFLEVEKINLEKSDGNTTVIYKGKCLNEEDQIELYHNFYANDLDELYVALANCFEGYIKKDFNNLKTMLRNIASYIDGILESENEVYRRNYSFKYTLDNLPRTEEDYYNEYEEEYEEGSYEWAIKENIKREIKRFNGYSLVERHGELLPMRYTVAVEKQDKKEVIKVSVYPIQNSSCFTYNDRVLRERWNNPIYFEAEVRRGEDGAIGVLPLYNNNFGRHRYYSVGIPIGDYDTRNKMISDLCKPIQYGVLHILIKSYFENSEI